MYTFVLVSNTSVTMTMSRYVNFKMFYTIHAEEYFTLNVRILSSIAVVNSNDRRRVNDPRAMIDADIAPDRESDNKRLLRF